MYNSGVPARQIPSLFPLVLLLLLAACGGGGGGGDSGGGGTPPPGGGTPPATWTKRAEGGDTISAVARSGSTFVALTEENLLPGRRVLTSSDGHTWSHPSYTGSPSFGDIVFGNGLFVAVGDSPVQVATSPDGVTWTTRLNSFGGPDLYSVAWSGSAFVAVGEGGFVRRSSDGVTWTAPTTPPVLGAGTLSQLRSVAGDGVHFAAVGADHATLDGAIFHSADGGVTWTAATVTPASDFEFQKVVWDGARFLAASGIGVGTAGVWTSTDGAAWTQLTSNTISKLTPAGSGAYIGTNGVGMMRTSTDAINWTNRYDFVHNAITDVLWMQDRGEYLVTGSASDSRGFIATSTDAITWHARYTSDRRTAALWDGSRFVSIDSPGRVHTSADGVSWASSNIIPAGGITRVYNDIAWSGSQYVAVGLDQIVSSPDASNWTSHLFTLREFVDATWNGTEFAAITRNREIFRSATGTSWPVSGTGIGSSGSLNDLAWSDTLTRYVAVGSGGNVFFSDDGTSWTPRTAGTGSLRSVTWDGSQYVAVGDGGAVFTSATANTWVDRSIAAGPTFNAVAFVNNQLIAVGNGGRIFVSSNGINWTEETSGTTLNLFAVAASPARAVAMGDTAVIVSRP